MSAQLLEGPLLPTVGAIPESAAHFVREGLRRSEAMDVHFSYCWPSQMRRVQEHFLEVAPNHAKLLICNGASDIRCKVMASE
jgi:hypothetical protein